MEYFMLESGAWSLEFGCKSRGDISIAKYYTKLGFGFQSLAFRDLSVTLIGEEQGVWD